MARDQDADNTAARRPPAHAHVRTCEGWQALPLGTHSGSAKKGCRSSSPRGRSQKTYLLERLATLRC